MSETLTRSDEFLKVYEEGHEYSAVESDDSLAEALEGNRNAVHMLAENTGMDRVQADALEEWLIGGARAENKALEDALTTIRPLLTAKYEGVIRTPGEIQSDASNLMLDGLLQYRLPETLEHMCTLEETVKALQLEFGADTPNNPITDEEVAWLQCDGLLTLAKSAGVARREYADHNPDDKDSQASNVYNPYIFTHTLNSQSSNGEYAESDTGRVTPGESSRAGAGTTYTNGNGTVAHSELRKTHPSKSTPVPWTKREEPWASEAACLKADPNIFFPEKGGSVREAKRICSSCEVRQECLGFSLDNRERFGIWGGLSERERRKVLHMQGLTMRY